MSAPDPAEVRARTGPCYGRRLVVAATSHCGHTKAEHRPPLVTDGRCTRCSCIGWDPMSGEEWDAVYGEPTPEYREADAELARLSTASEPGEQTND